MIIDSSNGGSLMVYSNDTQQYELVGITSYCNASTSGGVFIRTVSFFDWILGILKNPPLPPLPPTTLPTRPPITTPTTKPDILGKFQNLLRRFELFSLPRSSN